MAGTSAHTMLTGIILFFICEISALSVAVFGGSALDLLEQAFYNNGLYSVAGEWGNNASWYAYDSVVNIFYLCPYILAGLGVVILFLTIWARHISDDEDDETEYYRGGGGNL